MNENIANNEKFIKKHDHLHNIDVEIKKSNKK